MLSWVDGDFAFSFHLDQEEVPSGFEWFKPRRCWDLPAAAGSGGLLLRLKDVPRMDGLKEAKRNMGVDQ